MILLNQYFKNRIANRIGKTFVSWFNLFNNGFNQLNQPRLNRFTRFNLVQPDRGTTEIKPTSELAGSQLKQLFSQYLKYCSELPKSDN
jgi:hypothetical protein